jgi:hypothetical protein
MSSYCFLNSYAFLAIIISKFPTIILSAEQAMKISINCLMAGLVLTLTACSSQEVKQDSLATPAPTDTSPSTTLEKPVFSGQNPAMTINKSGKKLHLVRIMDGAACKNELEGAKGSFLIYADPIDIARIKQKQGTKVFTDFEYKIQAFSADALQQAVDATNLGENPFALGKDEAQEELAKALNTNFRQAANPAIAKFEQETHLTIDIAAYPSSLEFYHQGCHAALSDAAEPETNQSPK